MPGEGIGHRLVERGIHGEVVWIELIQIPAVTIEQLAALRTGVPHFDHRGVADLVLKVGGIGLYVRRRAGTLEGVDTLADQSRQSLGASRGRGLFFTAGPDNYANGLFGVITVAP